MAGTKKIILEDEYTLNKLIERIGGNKNTWRSYLIDEVFYSKFDFLVRKRNFLKFKLLVSEEELKELYITTKDKRAGEARLKNIKKAGIARISKTK